MSGTTLIEGDWEEKTDFVEKHLFQEHREKVPVVVNGGSLTDHRDADTMFEGTGKPRDYVIERNEDHALIVTPGGQWLDRNEHAKITDDCDVGYWEK